MLTPLTRRYRVADYTCVEVVPTTYYVKLSVNGTCDDVATTLASSLSCELTHPGVKPPLVSSFSMKEQFYKMLSLLTRYSLYCIVNTLLLSSDPLSH